MKGKEFPGGCGSFDPVYDLPQRIEIRGFIDPREQSVFGFSNPWGFSQELLEAMDFGLEFCFHFGKAGVGVEGFAACLADRVKEFFHFLEAFPNRPACFADPVAFGLFLENRAGFIDQGRDTPIVLGSRFHHLKGPKPAGGFGGPFCGDSFLDSAIEFRAKIREFPRSGKGFGLGVLG